jgi:hypothetical protein
MSHRESRYLESLTVLPLAVIDRCPIQPRVNISVRLVEQLSASMKARLRIANDIALLAELDGRRLEISDREGPETIVIASDEPLLYSLERLGFVSLFAPGVKR